MNISALRMQMSSAPGTSILVIYNIVSVGAPLRYSIHLARLLWQYFKFGTHFFEFHPVMKMQKVVGLGSDFRKDPITQKDEMLYSRQICRVRHRSMRRRKFEARSPLATINQCL